MNNRKGKEKFKNYHILLDSGCSSTIVMGRLVLIKKLPGQMPAVLVTAGKREEKPIRHGLALRRVRALTSTKKGM